MSFACVLAAPGAARAHMGSTKYVDARVHEDEVELGVQVEAIDVAVAVGLTSSDLARGQHPQVIRGWLGRGLILATDIGRCVPTFGTPEHTTLDGRPFVSLTINYACPPGASALTLTDNLVFADDPAHQTFVTVSTAAGQRTEVLHSSAHHVDLVARSSRAATAYGFLGEGALHLITGYDHLLFLLALILVAGLVVRREGTRRAVRDIAWIVTAFTLGHSVSLCAAALDVIAVPSAWVEAAIAGSIVVVAMLNVLRPRAPARASRRARTLIAGAFGIVHGFGFSSVLADADLDVGDRIIALASFNIGIELAQLGFVALALVSIARIARHPRYVRWGVQGGSLVIALMGAVWLVERSLVL